MPHNYYEELNSSTITLMQSSHLAQTRKFKKINATNTTNNLDVS